jgi:hypothetical protein
MKEKEIDIERERERERDDVSGSDASMRIYLI